MTLPASIVLPAVYKYAATRTWSLTEDDWAALKELEQEASQENYYEGDA